MTLTSAGLKLARMAVSRAQPEQIKSTPDLAKIQAFSGLMVTVTKHRAPRGTVGAPVVNTQRMTLENLLALQTTLPLQSGPGFYRFEVADAGGNGVDTFMQQLGGDVPEQEVPMAVSPTGSPGPAPAGPDIIHLGNGFYYNSTMKLLTTPWRKIYPWEEGQPLPEQPPSSPAASHFMQPVPPNATPWNWPGAQSGWGGFPVNDDSTKVKELEARLADERRQREMQQLRDEVKANNAAVSAAIEKLALALSAKPAGPSESEVALKRELEEQRRRQEDREREDRIRAEIRAQQERTDAALAAITANKTDPMMPMLLQLITSVQQSASETVKSIQAQTQMGLQASERGTQQMIQQLSGSILSPMQLMDMIRHARGDAAEGAKSVVEAARESLSMQREVFQQLLEVSSQGEQPAWLQAVRELSSTVVGPLGNALAQRQQQQQQPPMPQRRAVAPQQMRQPPAAAMPGAPMQHPPVALPPAAAASEAAHQQRTAQPRTAPETERDRAAASVAHFTHAPTSPGATGAPVLPVNGQVAPATPVLLQEVVTPEVSATGGGLAGATVTPIAAKRGAKAKNPRVKKQPAPAPPPPPVEPPKGYTIDQLRDADPDDMRLLVSEMDDEKLFGVALSYVQQLRESTDGPEAMAVNILASRQYLASFGGVVPPGMELLLAHQVEVLVERLLPDRSDEERLAVTQALADALEAEAGEEGDEDDDEDDDEGEEEGDEA